MYKVKATQNGKTIQQLFNSLVLARAFARECVDFHSCNSVTLFALTEVEMESFSPRNTKPEDRPNPMESLQERVSSKEGKKQ